MIDFEQVQLLIYQHVVQLTLIDHPVADAFALAHEVAALAFDEHFTRQGLVRAVERHAERGPTHAASGFDDDRASRGGA